MFRPHNSAASIPAAPDRRAQARTQVGHGADGGPAFPLPEGSPAQLLRDDIPLPRTPRRQIPIVLSTDEVRRLIDAAPNLRYRTILMTLYDTGMRRAELCQLRPEHIDKERMIIRIPHGKGGKAREVPLSSQLREQLRTYYRSLPRRNGWMFPSLESKRPD